jgi:hypothetical protein
VTIVWGLGVWGKEREDPRRLTRLEIESPDPATKGGVVEEKDTKDIASEEVEGHSLADRPVGESPVADRKGEDPDVEGHAMADRPVNERPVNE